MYGITLGTHKATLADETIYDLQLVLGRQGLAGAGQVHVFSSLEPTCMHPHSMPATK